MRNNFLLYLLIAVLVASIFINFSLIEKKENIPPTSHAQIANPASVNCINQGGKLEIREDQAGNQSGYCLFSEGKECEEWQFYRGECNQAGQPVTPFCGSSIKSACKVDTDCVVGGCSNQLCYSIYDNPMQDITTCEYQNCYDAKKYNLECKCFNQQCQWGSSYYTY